MSSQRGLHVRYPAVMGMNLVGLRLQRIPGELQSNRSLRAPHCGLLT